MKNLFIKSTDKLDMHGMFRPDDMLISLGDIAFGGSAISGGPLAVLPKFAVDIASIGHILTRIVLSDRLVFVYSREGKSGPIEVLMPELERYCKTLVIDEDHPAINDVKYHAMTAPDNVFGEDLVTNVRQHLMDYAPWGFDVLTRAWLGEYALSQTIGVPFAPNPFLSRLLRAHTLSGGRSDADIVLSYLEDLRRETATEINSSRKLNVYDLELPAIFGAVLRDSKTPADLVRVASQMNDDAKAFRKWCRNLTAEEKEDPQGYIDQLHEAQASLSRLASSLNSKKGERMQVSPPGGLSFLKLPSATVTRLVNWFDVDVHFARPRHFLLSLLRSARQIRSLSEELARVFDVPTDYAKAAADHYLKLATDFKDAPIHGT